MTQNWKAIWNKRSSESEKLTLDNLIKLDGFDTGAGKIEPSDWRIMTSRIADKLKLENGNSIYEVGCGAGAFIMSLTEEYELTYGGIDYAEGLIKAAKRAMPEGNWEHGEAKDLSLTPKYDFVISHGVFHYFDESYASGVIDKMIDKAKKSIAILEVPDLETKEELESIRRDKLSKEEYEKKYKGLEHTYYSKDWFKNKANQLNLNCNIIEGCVPNYAQNDYRFGVIIKRI
jgi:trans-aconitate methyltransferase